MDFNSLVDSKVQVAAKVQNIINSDRNGVTRIVLCDVYVNGSYFRDHTWIKSTKRLDKLSAGDKFTATAILHKYPSVNNSDKFGLKTIRSVKVVF